MKFNISRLNGKITLATLKALIAAGDELFIRINSRFDGMTDGVECIKDAAFFKANTEKNGLEIRFNSRPPQTTLESLKSAGWRWSKFAACWWIKDSPSARGFATIFGSVA